MHISRVDYLHYELLVVRHVPLSKKEEGEEEQENYLCT